MATHPQPPPEANLIRDRREAPPKMSRRHAAELAEMSEGRWRQLENGGYRDRGQWRAETAPPQTLARMARAVGVTEDELRQLGKDEAAAELAALPPLGPKEESIEDLFRRYLKTADEERQHMRRLEAKLDRVLGDQADDDEEEEQGHGRAAG